MTKRHMIATCHDCGTSWDIDYEPSTCTCDDPPPDAWTLKVTYESDDA